MDYLVVLDDGPDVIVEGVDHILNEDNEVIFRDGSDTIIGMFSKNSYKAIIANVQQKNDKD